MNSGSDIFGSYRRIVIKIGSRVLVDSADWRLRYAWLESFADDIIYLSNKYDGIEFVIVSSGAIAVGRGKLDLHHRPLPRDNAAAAATGQMALSHAWQKAFRGDISVAQMLLTLHDTELRKRHVNARNTILRLLKLGVVPIINENDTVVMGDSRYGDNDRLAARIATMVGGDLLLLLGEVDGLYSGNPDIDSGVEHIDLVTDLSSVMGYAEDRYKPMNRGGMSSKLRAAEIAVNSGVDMIIASGMDIGPLRHLGGGGRHTLFRSSESGLRARKHWIRGSLRSAGAICVDAGAMDALIDGGRSLLAAGVRDVIGDFSRGDAVDIVGEDSVRWAIGLVAYDSGFVREIRGKHSHFIEKTVGRKRAGVIVHRDDLVIL